MVGRCFDSKMTSTTVATVLLTFFACDGLGYIIPSGKEPRCPSVQCQNDGILINRTCTCACSDGFMGLFCEHEKQPTKWPMGSYAIPTSTFGCPETENYGWSMGHINLTLPKTSRVILWNDRDVTRIEPHILGPFAQRVMQLNFCVRRDHNNSDWPQGDYCIYRLGQVCPEGFNNGSIVIRGYEFGDTDIGGTLPDFETGNNTYLKLYFCCRSDGNGQSSDLFYTFPYVLFKGSGAANCQTFEGTEVEEEPVFMTNELVDWEFNGSYPAVNRSGRHVGIPYCYYTPYARRECYYKDDYGASYRGRTNVSKSGLPCVTWLDIPDDLYKDDKFWTGEFEDNFCNTVDLTPEEGKPMCFTDINRTREACNIPQCPDDPSLVSIGRNKPVFSHKVDSRFYTFQAVDGIYGGVSFSTSRPQMKPFLQLDLQEWYEVHAILVYRTSIWFPVNFRFVGTFVSKNQWDFLDYGALRCDDVRNPRKSKYFRFQCKRPITGQYITVRNFDSTDPVSNSGKYFYLTINEIRVLGKATRCGQRLGMTSGDIFEYQMYSSSNINMDTNAIHARLGRPNAGWCPSIKDKQPWYTVDLVFPIKVEGLLIQGWNEGSKGITIKEFILQYGIDEDDLMTYEDPVGTVKIFKTDQTMMATAVQRFILSDAILTRYVKIQSLMPGKDACLKLEVLGCPLAVTRDVWCRNYTMDYGFEEMQYHAWWMEETDLSSRWFQNITKEETINKCLSLDWCLSYNYNTDRNDALLHEGHRYNLDHESWWVTHVSYTNYGAHRLCFTDISGTQDCGGKIRLYPTQSVTITSPGFPFNYRDGVYCKWIVQSSPGFYVELDIIDISIGKTVMWNEATQGGFPSENVVLCSERLIISGGNNPAITITYTPASQGKFKFTKIISSTSELQLTLKSCFHYSEVGRRNFELRAKEIDLPGCGIESGICTITCKMPAAYIATSRFPAAVKKTETCNWKLEGAYGQYIRLEIEHLDIEDNDGSCRKSYLSVYDVNIDGQISLMARMCKSSRTYGILISSWHKMQVEFRAGDAIGSGFLGRYYLVDFAQKSPNITSAGCEDNWYSYERSCYRMFSARSNETNRGVTWIQAEQSCVKMGGHLASIGTLDEMSYIHYLMTKVWDGLTNGETQMYIGLKKVRMENGRDIVYEWTDGTPLTFTAWFKDSSSIESQPNGLMNERCSMIKLKSLHTMDDWHDVPCAYNGIQNFMCEVPQDTNVNASSNSRLNPMNYSMVTRATPFVCDDEVVISRAFVCDGFPDCLDGSDENECAKTCTLTQFQCDSGECVSVSSYCDFIDHCQDGSDEYDCVRPACDYNEWRCRNQQCVPKVAVCDLKIDCRDGSDEQDCDKCEQSNFECYDETCIKRSRVCDGTIDCSGNSFEDEDQQCLNKAQASCSDWFNLGATSDGEYNIDLGRNDIVTVECKFSSISGRPIIQTIVHHNQEEPILVRLTHLDKNISYNVQPHQIQTILDRSECYQMISLRCHFSIEEFEWHGGKGKIHSLHKDGWASGNCDCPFLMNCSIGNDRGCNCATLRKDWYTAEANEERMDMSKITDEDHLPITYISTSAFPTPYRYFIIEVGPLICEQVLPANKKSFLCRSGVPVDSRQKCILDYDEFGETKGCRDLSHLDECAQFVCPKDHIKCTGHYCIPVRLLCDGIKHCQDGEDEYGCDAACPKMFRCHKSRTCIAQNEVCDGYPHCPEGDDEKLCHNTTCPPSCVCDELVIECFNVTSLNHSMFFSPLARKLSFRNSNFNESVPNLEIFLLAELDMSNCSILQLESNNFRHLQNLYDLDLSMNFLTTLKTSTFTGLENLKSLNLKGNPYLKMISPMSFDGLSKLPELEIHQTWVNYIAKGAFKGLTKLKKLNLTRNKISKVEDDAFVALETLDVLDIRNNRITDFSDGIFKGLPNLTKLYTDAYVFCCLRPSTVTEENCLPYRDEFSSCSDLMRNDVLRLFLWVMGISSLIGNIGVVVYKVVFDKRSRAKGHGIFITNLGLSDLCMGIYLLIIAIADVAFRGKYLWNDISWRNGYMCAIAGVLATVSSEASVLFLFLITVDRLLSVKFPFGQIQFNANKARFTSLCVWILCVMAAIIPLLPINYFKGQFYSRSAVCLALPLTRDRPAGWQYGTALFICLNFILFLCIVVGQILIYKEISTTDNIIKSQRRTQDAAIARSLFAVVFSDFLCWFPIGVMGLMALSGQMIPGEVYAWTAVFILPINSALNPYLYTFSGIMKQSKSGSFRFRSKLSGSSKSNEISTQRDLKWTEICQSDKFLLGAHVTNGVTLKDVYKKVHPNVELLYDIVTDLAKSLEFLHRRNMVHGYISEENIIVCIEDGILQSVHSKVIPSSQEKDIGMAKDVEEFGRIVLKLLKWFQESQKKVAVSEKRY